MSSSYVHNSGTWEYFLLGSFQVCMNPIDVQSVQLAAVEQGFIQHVDDRVLDGNDRALGLWQ